MKYTCSKCFKNLGVGSRLKIYTYLEKKGTKNVTQITKRIGLRQPTISYHLGQMEKSGLLDKEQKGKEVYYSARKICPHDGVKCVVNSND
jgi:ArsR family transcriptional regulator, arsenate/arsenite/antimonite-responsive transcriptional repressor